jgi:hypothetical protein
MVRWSNFQAVLLEVKKEMFVISFLLGLFLYKFLRAPV